jgi:archaellum component FlaC
VFLLGGMLLYACMINLVFFNSINISTINAENIGSMMSLFARVNFSIPFNTTVSIIMAGVILFGASYLESKSKWWLGGILIFDFLLAYTIENQVADLKTAMGLEVKLGDLFLEGFAIAIFSFFGYFGFAQSLAKLKSEIDKKNPHKGIKIKIETLKNRIAEAEKMIGIVENKIANILKQIASIETEIQKLNNRVEYLHSNVEDVLKSLDSFATGWLNYLSARKVPQEQIVNTRNVYVNFLTNKTVENQEQEAVIVE